MRAPLFVVALLLSFAACKKAKQVDPTPAVAPPTSTAAQDALWALTPEGATVGFVMSPRALEQLEAGALAVDKAVKASPDLAQLRTKLYEEMQDALGTTVPSLAALGMTSGKGLAAFAIDGRPLMILPVSDRDKFLAMAHGQKGADGDTIKRATCKTVRDYYVCAREPDQFDRLGKGNLATELGLAGARGDIEVAATIPGRSTVAFGAIAQLGRGTMVVRGGAKGVPGDALQLLANAKPRVDGDHTAGFAVVNLMPFIHAFASRLPPLPIVAGVNVDELVRTVAGPLTMTMANGAAVFDLQVPLTDGALAHKLVEQCTTIPGSQQLGVTVSDGVCHAPVPQLQMELDAWVDGKVLHVGKRAGQTGPEAKLSAAARELANGEWAFAMFGHGTLFGPTKLPVTPGMMPAEAMLALRGLAMLNELGIGVRVDGDVVRVFAALRTAWSNPDDVVDKLVAIDFAKIVDGTAGPVAKAIADAAPGSPFAADFAAGSGGLMMPAAIIGVLSAVTIPAYLDYMKKSKKSEAALQLDKLERNLKVAAIANTEYPKGSVGPTPAKPCCETGGRCQPDPAAWSDPVWQALDFQLDDPHLFRYSYESKDGRSYVAKAIGDLDCDGIEIEYVLTGSLVQGNPTSALVEPPPSSD